MSEKKPLILFTNDDGISSPGLWAVVEAFDDLGEVLVVAPRLQQSAMARSLPMSSEGRIYVQEMLVRGRPRTVYAADAAPAQAVLHGILELAPRKPSLVVSGINYGENIGNGITISGTIGAALEGASMGIPSIAVSQQTPFDLHLTYSNAVDFSASAYFARKFGKWLMSSKRPPDLDVLKIDVPLKATPQTPWRVTRLSRGRIYWPTRPQRTGLSDIGRVGYHYDYDPSQAEPDSDVYAVLHEGVVSVTPLSLDLTSRIDLQQLQQMLDGK